MDDGLLDLLLASAPLLKGAKGKAGNNFRRAWMAAAKAQAPSLDCKACMALAAFDAALDLCAALHIAKPDMVERFNDYGERGGGDRGKETALADMLAAAAGLYEQEERLA